MKINFIITFLFLIYLPIALYSQSEWVKPFGGRNYNNGSGPYTKVDKQGNIFIAGKNELISFDNNTTSITGCYLTKLDSLGRLVWQKQIGDFFLNNQIIGLTVNEAGDAFVVVNCNEMATFFGQVSFNNLGGSAIARYSSDGQLMWATKLLTAFGFARYVGIDNQNNLYFTSSRTAANNIDNEYYLLKISGGNGSELFNRVFIQYSSAFYTQLNDMVTDKFGNTYIGGNCKTPNLLLAGQDRPVPSGAFCIKLDSAGQVVWFNTPIDRGEATNFDFPSGTFSNLSISDDGTRLYALGLAPKNTRLNTSGLTNGDISTFYTKINANTGNYEWLKTYEFQVQKILSEGNNTWLYMSKHSFSSDYTHLTLEGGKNVIIEPFVSSIGATTSYERAYISPINDVTGEMRPLSILSDEGVYSYITINQNRIIGVNNNFGKIYGRDSLYQLNTTKMFALFSLPKSLLTYQPFLQLDSLTAQSLCESSLVKINAQAQNMRLGNRFRLYTDHVGEPYTSFFALNEGRQVDTTRYPYLDLLSLHHAYKLHSKMRLCSSSPSWCSEQLDLTQPTILLKDTTFCYGNTIEVKSDLGLNYQWTPTRLFQNPIAQSNIIKPDTVVVIKLLAKTNLGCSRSDSVKITTVRPLFDIPDSLRLSCNDFDDHITLDATVKGGFHYGLTYSWVNPMTDLSFTSVDNAGIIKDAYPSKSGQYKVIVKDDYFKCTFADSTYCTVEPCKILRGQSTSSLINVEVYQKTPQDSVDWRLVKRTKGTGGGYYQVRLPMQDSAKFRFISDPSLWSSPSQTNFPMFYDSTFFISQSKTVKFSNLDTLTLNGNRWRLATNYKTSTVSGYVFDYYNPSTPLKNYELFLIDSSLYAKRRLTGIYADNARIAYDKTDSTGRFSIKINEDPSVTYQFYGNRMDTRADTLIAPKLVIPTLSNIRNIILYKKDSFLIACDNCGQFKGNIFKDGNSNCLPDANDKPASNAIVQINPGNILVTASDTGQFNIYLKSGNYTVSTTPPQYYSESCSTNGTNTLNFTLNSDTISKNFGFRPIPNIADVAVELTPETAFRPGFQTAIQIDVTNKGTTPVPVILKFNYTDTVELLGTNPLYSSNANRQLTWTIPTLNIGETKNFVVLMRFKPDVNFLGKKATFSSQIVVNNSLIDANLNDNTDTISQIIRGSYDPNDKQVTPRGPNLGNQVLPSVNEYEFLIRFQNTGTDTAFTVAVRDTLTNEWDVASLQTIASSHPYKFNLEKNNIAIWTFRNILLPDSTTNETQSHGFVKFVLKTKTAPLSIGSVLTNKAGIYFDYNPPVITNQVRLNVVNKLTNAVQEIVSLAKIYPNPASDNLIIDLIGNTQPTQIVVNNVLGQVLKTAQFEGKNHNLDVQSLENGVYMLSIRQGERVQNMSFMVQR